MKNTLRKTRNIVFYTLYAVVSMLMMFGSVAPVFADKLPASEIKALDQYPNWVGLCGSSFSNAQVPAAGAGGATNGVTFTAEMTIDDDGIGPSHGDPDHQSSTSYADGRLNADETNYIALAQGYARAHGLQLGDIALVEHGSSSAYAVYGDNWQNVNEVHGEGSVHLSKALGGDASNTIPAPVKFTVYPGTHTKLAGSVDQAKIDQIGAQVSGGGAASAVDITGPVYILGDSISNAAKSQLSSAFQARGADVYTNASDSRSITGAGVTAGFRTSGLQAVDDDKTRIAASPTIVIELGTNPNPNFEKSIKDLIDKIRSYNSSATIFWVNLFSVGKGADKVDQTGTNKSIADLAGQLDYTVIDTVGKGIELEPDQVHETTPKGAKQLSKIIVDAVAAGLGGAVSPAAAPKCCASTTATVASTLQGKTNGEKAYNFFISKGLSPAAAAGIVGNLTEESIGVEPERLQGDYTNRHTAQSLSSSQLNQAGLGWGVAQFTPPKTFISVSRAKGASNAQLNDLTYQLTFIYNLISGSQKDYYKFPELQAATTPEDAAAIFLAGYERGNPNPTRQAYARAYYNLATKGTPLPSNVPVSTSDGGGGASADPSTPTTPASNCSTPDAGGGATADCKVTAPVYGSQKGVGAQYTQADLTRLFGDPGTAGSHPAISAALETVDFNGHSVEVHKLAAGCLKAVAADIKAKNVSYTIKQMGCYRYDSNNGSSNIGLKSYHTYGVACDINWDTNPFTDGSPAPHDMPPEYIKAFHDHGFTWGGNWQSVKDYMHFEFNGIKP